MDNFTEILELHDLAMEQALGFPEKRDAFRRAFPRKGEHFLGLVGPRGVGKSVLLRQRCRELGDKALYVSLDAVRGVDVFEMVKKAVQDYKIEHVFLDEVHFVSNIDQNLKKIYDFLKVDVTFTSSVAVAMHQSSSDLSRRVRLEQLYGFSFREYLRFSGQKVPDGISLKDLCSQQWGASHMRAGGYFHDYLQGGVMPYALREESISELQMNILSKVIERDLPSVRPMSSEDVALCYKMVKFIGRSKAEGISYSSLAKNLGATKYKTEIYVDLLEKAFVLHRVHPMGTNVLREPKILMGLPYRPLFKDFEDAIGGIREDFTVEHLKSIGLHPHYLKSTRGAKTPDYFLDLDPPLVLEVGGQGKGREQFKGIEVDQKLILADGDRVAEGKVPLFMLGFVDRID